MESQFVKLTIPKVKDAVHILGFCETGKGTVPLLNIDGTVGVRNAQFFLELGHSPLQFPHITFVYVMLFILFHETFSLCS